MDEKVAIEALRQVKDVFGRYDIEFWLDTGTLLGAIRDRKFIPWDSDIDLATWVENRDKILEVVPKIGRAGFWVRYKVTILPRGKVYVLAMMKNGVKITVCLMQKKKNVMMIRR